MEKVKNIALLLFLAVFVASLCLNVHHCTMREQEPYRDTIRTTFVDTIPYYKPVPKEEKPLGNITAKLPVSVPKLPENVQKFPESGKNLQDSVQNFGKSVPDDHFEDMGEKVTPDSADVVVPITQTVYEDSTYTAYVSGYRASLDSLIFRMPREVTTITNTHYQKPKRWSIGIQVGYGMTLKGTPQFAPYVGIGVSYNLFSF
ncbi:MAG: hypothetical protein IJZ22_06295 [Bacteroidaceae bacterium]|nr:hypothetical protein [Bacteroidaceae bacterium]